MTNQTSTGIGLSISSTNGNSNGVLYSNSAAGSGVFYGIGSVLSSTNIVSGYNGYRNSSGLSYGLLGINGTNASYATNANTWALFSQGRAVISSESSPTSGLGTDLEIRNTTSGSGNPVTLSMRQTTSNSTNNTILANINFGDNYSTGAQASIQAVRGAAGGAGDLPTDIVFNTTPDGSATIAERMRITSAGVVRVGNLAGTGMRMVQADASGNLSAPAAFPTGDDGYIQNGTAAQTADYNITGNGTIGGALNFGSTTRQMLNLYSTSYGIGVQSNTQYYRSAANFAWFKGGIHNGTAFNSGGGTTMMVLNTNGNLGIGNTGPTTTLSVGPNPVARFNASELLQIAQTGDAYLAVKDGTASVVLGSTSGVGFVGTQTAHDFRVFTGNTERVRVAANGNVGINDAAPDASLEIGGNPNNAIRTAYLNISGNNQAVTDRAFVRGTADHLVIVPGGTSNTGQKTTYLTYPEGSGTFHTRIQEQLFINTDGRVGIGTTTTNNNKLYVTQTGVAGTGYATSSVNAIMGYGSCASYSYGVAGYQCGTSVRGGGVHGAYSAGTWGTLGYMTSGSAAYGLYYTSYSSGTGYLPSGGMMAGVGAGGYGEFMGSWTRGEVVGHMAAGELMASYNLGDEVTSGRQIEIVNGAQGRSAAYTTTSPDQTVTKAGVAQLSNGTSTVRFDKTFMNLIDGGKMPIVTVTPIGESNGVHIVSCDRNGFEVKENRGGTSNVQFTYMVVAQRADASTSVIEDVLEPSFDSNLREFMFNEGIRERDAKPMWWDGTRLRFDPVPSELQVKKQ